MIPSAVAPLSSLGLSRRLELGHLPLGRLGSMSLCLGHKGSMSLGRLLCLLTGLHRWLRRWLLRWLLLRRSLGRWRIIARLGALRSCLARRLVKSVVASGRHYGAPLSRLRCIHRAFIIRLGRPADRSLVHILLVHRTSPRTPRRRSVLLRRRSLLLRRHSLLLRRRSLVLRRPPYAPYILLRRPPYAHSVLLRRHPYAPCLRRRPCAFPTRRWRLSALISALISALLTPDSHSMHLPVTALVEFVIAPNSLFLPRADSRRGLLGGGGGCCRLPGRLPMAIFL